jgi:RNase adapter protein RapZ
VKAGPRDDPASSHAPIDAPNGCRARLVLVTGPPARAAHRHQRARGSGLRDDRQNLPLSLLPRLLDDPPLARPLALGLDPRNRDFSTDALIEAIDRLARAGGAEVLYLDCRPEVLVRRYLRNPPPPPAGPGREPEAGIAREADLLAPVRARADILIDTSELTPARPQGRDRALVTVSGARRLAVSLHSFSYKRGCRAGVDMVFDVRFLRNPYWDAGLRP